MKRIICHWTAGAYKANGIDIAAYHELFEGDGKIVKGKFPISANSSAHGPLKTGQYAAHTLSLNTDSIGLSLCCMAGAVEGKTNGSYPMTEVQFEALCKRAAEHCRMYGIAITPQTVLSHAEVQGTLGVKQKNKWDYTVLPFKPSVKGAKACGDYLRARIKSYYEISNKPVAPAPAPVVAPVKNEMPQSFWLLSFISSLFGRK